jgi:hypothetical protein
MDMAVYKSATCTGCVDLPLIAEKTAQPGNNYKYSCMTINIVIHLIHGTSRYDQSRRTGNANHLEAGQRFSERHSGGVPATTAGLHDRFNGDTCIGQEKIRWV